MSDNIINLVIECPHCNEPILIEQLNCKIFRHGVFTPLDLKCRFYSTKIGILNLQGCKSTNQQIEPHLSKDKCDELILNNLIYGCGKPFKIISNDDNFKVEICDYI